MTLSSRSLAGNIFKLMRNAYLNTSKVIIVNCRKVDSQFLEPR